MRRYIVIGYLIFISVAIGLILTLGALVAPVVFHSDELIEQAISHYSQGLIMQEIFSRSQYILLALGVAIFAYELYDYRHGKRDGIVLASAFAAVFTIAMFSFYYIPEMIVLQQAQQTDGEAFKSLHLGSELDFKIMLFTLTVLLFRRFTQLVRKR